MKRIMLGQLLGLVLLTLGRRLRSGEDEPLVAAGEALWRGDCARAVDCYREAARQGVDPVRIAHNLGVALYQVQRFQDAEEQFRDSAAAGDLSAARAAYDCGNCLLHEALPAQQPTSAELLAKAAAQYQACLAQQEGISGAESLFEDARHNLELARLLLAQTTGRESPPNGDQVASAEDLCPT